MVVDRSVWEAYVAGELRKLRILAKISQEQVAHYLGISPQQYGKYERAEDKISAGRFFEAKNFLESIVAERGFAEEQSDYAAPPLGGFQSTGHDTIRRDWEALKVTIDRLIASLLKRPKR